ncbi:fidgetin-like protein 1 [Nematocida homosporus]|uniref:fidgetin-like protein 1 n=1 Tax=Nematocida homosporus TaxID=1912981 RepID=UPI00221F36C3|nr:fidgetin-like protein 1 [Nematocida homosporus]KAI5187231.1 fidgetin-like protein 1 [Nematocida homosporus]
MQKNYFDLQQLLEELTQEYTSPYDNLSDNQKAQIYLQRDYEYLLAAQTVSPELVPLVHDYPILRPALTIAQVEELISQSNRATTPESAVCSACSSKLNSPNSSSKPRLQPNTQISSNTSNSNANSNSNSNRNSGGNSGLLGFTSARSQLSPEDAARLPKSTSKSTGSSTSTGRVISSTLANHSNSVPNNTDENSESPVDAKLLQMIYNEVLHPHTQMSWDEIAGLVEVKTAIKEIIIWPMLRPDLFKGLRGPPRALLLFGPPGTGKTLIGRCIASQAEATFFSISASSLTSKWVGEGEKMVRALFYAAMKRAPAVIFIDEIDSLLMQRTEGENESTRRLKTELLIQMDGARACEEHVLVIGATNRPQEIDEAARRRFVKRLYIPLPDKVARAEMIKQIGGEELAMDSTEIEQLAEGLAGYSGSDIFNLCREAAMEAVRELSSLASVERLRKIGSRDFQKAMAQIRKSVSEKDLKVYSDWNEDFGSTPNIPAN